MALKIKLKYTYNMATNIQGNEIFAFDLADFFKFYEFGCF